MTPDRLQKLYDKLIAQANSHYANAESVKAENPYLSSVYSGEAIAMEKAAWDLSWACILEGEPLTTTDTNSRKDIDESNKEAMQAELVNEEN